MFTLHAQLERDTFLITNLPLCRALLMNNALFPWIILVPRVEGAREILDLSPEERHPCMDEIAQASAVMQYLFLPDKLNMAALGNQVPQLHVHVIARYTGDAAWPEPVWGKGFKPYEDPELLRRQLESAFLPAGAL
jgi:diadenosine tetraphosphate (Ap4A) HIT family hydrolase